MAFTIGGWSDAGIANGSLTKRSPMAKLKARHSALSRAESARKKRIQKKNQERFIRDPFQFARQLFQQPKSETLTVVTEELETHLKKTYSDPTREIPLGETTGLVRPAAPGIKFDSKPPSLQEVIAVVNKARAKFAPGPNGVPYLLYKRCPNVLKKLHKILRSAWKNIQISKGWVTAERGVCPRRARFERNKPVSPNITAQCIR
ncbi:polyprotein [Plakobranchus ocellatus]|uniref:Polyprotein n=1 Tax=Plakobranchus ocellatus TaxID=259542 RepID=A0AAV3YDN3_9GAST|nr:polyprotein [Plakobranchus ocellatus]